MKKIFSKTKILISSTFFILFSFCIKAQDIDVNVVNADFPKDVTVAGPNSSIIIQSAGVAGNVFWGITGHTSVPGPSCPGSSSSTETYDCNGVHVVLPVHSTDVGVPVSSAGHPENNATISFPGTLTAGQIITITLTVTSASNPGLSKPKNYIIKVVQPRDVMLVLDRSGSMSTITSGSVPPISRWVALRNATSLFMTAYEGFHITGDRVGITFFDDHADIPPPAAPFGAAPFFIPVTSVSDPTPSHQKVLDAIPATPSFGSTAMGEGMLAGIAKHAGANQHAMLLFTDGIQNSGDLVTPDGTHVGAAAITGEKIFTVGFDAPGDAQALLGSIALSNGTGSDGFKNTQTGDASDVALFNLFNTTVPAVLNGSSPQIIDVRMGVFDPQKPIVETFTVNKSIDRLLFEVVGLNYANIISVKQNGVERISSGTITRGPNYVTFFDSLSGNASSEGDWTITANSYYGDFKAAGTTFQSGKYFVAAMVDDHLIDYKCGSGNSSFKVGDKFTPSVSLSYIGKTIKNATIKAIILKPGEDLGDLLARANVKVDTTNSVDQSVAEKIYQELLKDSNFVNKLKATNQLINLTFRASDSSYTGNYTFSDNSGIYQVIYLIDDTHPVTGKVIRYNQQSLYVRFPDVNLDSSQVNFVITQQTNVSTLTFRPIAINGKFIGPGWGNSIVIDGNNIKITNLVDNGDGTYSLTINGNPSENVTVSIGGDKIYTGKLENIGKHGGIFNDIFKHWWFWLIVIIILIIIWLITRKKKP